MLPLFLIGLAAAMAPTSSVCEQDGDCIVSAKEPITVTGDRVHTTIAVYPGATLTVLNLDEAASIVAERVIVHEGGSIQMLYGGSGAGSVDGSASGDGGGGGGGASAGRPAREPGCAPISATAGTEAGSDTSLPDPLLQLGGRGADAGVGAVGGAGGGALYLRADELEMYGSILASALDGLAGGGGGGGGAVLLEADRLVCRGLIEARGGSAAFPGGPGSGGTVVQVGESVHIPCLEVDVSGGQTDDSGSGCDILDPPSGLSIDYVGDYDGDLATDDCAPRNAAIPGPSGVDECNGLDDDCNGEVDEYGCGACQWHTNDGRTYQVCDDPQQQPIAEAACATLGDTVLTETSYTLMMVHDEASENYAQSLHDEFTQTSSGGFDAYWMNWMTLDAGTRPEVRYARIDGAPYPWHRPWMTYDECNTEAPDEVGGTNCTAHWDSGVCQGLQDWGCTDTLPFACELCVPTTYYQDLDHDGWGDLGAPIHRGCTAADRDPFVRVSRLAGDCDDGDPLRHPGMMDVCDGLDNDCDGIADPTGVELFDADGDGVLAHLPGLAHPTCASLAAGAPHDCDDDAVGIPVASDPGDVEPGVIDAIDDDCDGDIDEGFTQPCAVYQYETHSYLVCDGPAAFPTARDACTDLGYELVTIQDVRENNFVQDKLSARDISHAWLGAVNPGGLTVDWLSPTADSNYTRWGATEPNDYGGASELCVMMWAHQVDRAPGTWNDSDCSELVGYVCESPECQEEVYRDQDGDGFGNIDESAQRCPDEDWVRAGTDCDDTDGEIHPGAYDQPGNDVDENCDEQLACYLDDDGDGHGVETEDDLPQVPVLESCDQPGVSSDATDCDDEDDEVYPGANVVMNDEVDDDCDGFVECRLGGKERFDIDQIPCPEDTGTPTDTGTPADTDTDTDTDVDVDTDTDTDADTDKASTAADGCGCATTDVWTLRPWSRR